MGTGGRLTTACMVSEGFVVHGGDLGAAAAGSGAFLVEPAAFGADLAGRELVDHGGEDLRDAGGEAAVGSVEVRAVVGLAGGGEAKDLGGEKRGRHREHAGRGGNRLFEIGDFGAAGSLID